MRYIIAFSLCLLCAVSDVLAQPGPADKLQRGAVNIITSPLEIPREMRAHWIEGSQRTYHIIVWLLSGFIKGTVNVPVRLGSGVWDVCTFAVAVPEDYRPLVEPEYIWDQWPQRKVKER